MSGAFGDVMLAIKALLVNAFGSEEAKAEFHIRNRKLNTERLESATFIKAAADNEKAEALAILKAANPERYKGKTDAQIEQDLIDQAEQAAQYGFMPTVITNAETEAAFRKFVFHAKVSEATGEAIKNLQSDAAVAGLKEVQFNEYSATNEAGRLVTRAMLAVDRFQAGYGKGVKITPVKQPGYDATTLTSLDSTGSYIESNMNQDQVAEMLRALDLRNKADLQAGVANNSLSVNVTIDKGNITVDVKDKNGKVVATDTKPLEVNYTNGGR